MLPQLASVSVVSQLAKAACVGAMQKSTVGARQSTCHQATLAAEMYPPAYVPGSERFLSLFSIGVESGRGLLGRQLVKGTAAVLAPAYVFQCVGHQAAADQSPKQLCDFSCDVISMIV